MTDFAKQITELLDKVQRKRHIDVLLEQLIPQRTALREKCEQLRTIKIREEEDVNSLENGGIAGWVLDLFGKREQQLEKERREAYAAKMKYDTAMYELENLERQIDSYTREMYTLENCEKQLQSLLDANAASSERYTDYENQLALESQLALLKAKRTEMEEAIAAGQNAVVYADKILTYLDKADNWSTADFFLDSFLVDLAKHDNLDKATVEIGNLQTALGKFKSELADVTIDKNISIQIDGFLTFADYFWDGIFSNLEVQRKISDASRQVLDVKYKIQDTISKLTLMLNENSRQQQVINEKMNTR